MLPEDVIRQYSDMVYRIAFARAGSREDADDIYQEVFLRYIRKLPKFRDAEHEKAWFIRVTINCAKKLLGATRKKIEIPGELPKEEGLKQSRQGENSFVPTAEDFLFKQEQKDELYMELDKLSADARLLLHLYYFEEMKTGEIAKLLHKKESTVRVQLKRAREQMKKFFEEDGLG